MEVIGGQAMKPTPCSSERITSNELLLAGWHGVYTGNKQFWAHPDYCHNLVRFHEAARIEKARRG
jgi:hypothetical protein